MTQEIKIVNKDTGSEVFFSSQCFKTARTLAKEYIRRNKGKYRIDMYGLNYQPKPYPKWVILEKH